MGGTQILYNVVLFLKDILTFPHIIAYKRPSTNAVLLWTWLMWDLNISLLSRVTPRYLFGFLCQGIGVPKSEIVPCRPRRTTPVNVLRLFWKVHGSAFAFLRIGSPRFSISRTVVVVKMAVSSAKRVFFVTSGFVGIVVSFVYSEYRNG